MHNSTAPHDFLFPDINFGPNETPYNLNILLYKGASKANRRIVSTLIGEKKLGDPIIDRLELVSSIHAEISADLAGGGSRISSENSIKNIRFLFSFADENDLPMNVESVVNTFCAWADSLYVRTLNKKNGGGDASTLSMRSAYSVAQSVGNIIDRLLNRASHVVELTKIVHRPIRKGVTTVNAEKQNLEHTFLFGNLLLDLCDIFTLDFVRNTKLPVEIKLRNNKRFVQSPTSEELPSPLPDLYKRSHIINVRIEAELLMFVAQTGMNITQAVNSKVDQFFYAGHIDGYQVKTMKARRSGQVLFEIFKDYKSHFERYLDWRRAIFLDSSYLFPFVMRKGTIPRGKFAGVRISKICKKTSTAYIPPSTLRNTRVNWLLRRSADPDLTSEMVQHTKETLLSVYERPSLQRAIVESARFWSAVEVDQRTESIAPGGCTGVAKSIEDIPAGAPVPDCVKTSGCLWCENHRDIDSFEYLWALATFKHLKVIELSKAMSPSVDRGILPSHIVIDRINDKLRWYEESNKIRKDWVIETSNRIAEGDYHSSFNVEIIQLEE
jgi:integrase